MNKITCEFPSYSLKTQARIVVLLPKTRQTPFETGSAATAPFPALYLLHGAFENAEEWLWYTGLAGLVDELGIAVVLPNCANSFYVDEPGREAYYTYITEELPDYLRQILPLSRKREETFIGGFSMGGYGAVYAGLKKPQLYGKVFSMSGALDVGISASFVKAVGGIMPEPLRDRKSVRGSHYDLLTLVSQVDPAAVPEMLLTCGSEDYFLRATEAFRQISSQQGLRITTHITPGSHDWSYWQKALPYCMAWLVEKRA